MVIIIKYGKRIATLEGYATDPETGRVLEKGFFGRKFHQARNYVKSFTLREVFHDSFSETPNSTSDSSTNTEKSNPKENVHSSSPSSNSTSSINYTGENVNLA